MGVIRGFEVKTDQTAAMWMTNVTTLRILTDFIIMCGMNLQGKIMAIVASAFSMITGLFFDDMFWRRSRMTALGITSCGTDMHENRLPGITRTDDYFISSMRCSLWPLNGRLLT